MPLAVITVKNAPPSVRGDLSKWMQEIATGVYVGNFNSRIRDKLWTRIKENIGKGEATISYYCRNELGYTFDTFNTERFVVDIDGIPLVFLPNPEHEQSHLVANGFSDAANYRKWRKYSSSGGRTKDSFVVIDIETDGLNKDENEIIEVGAVKCDRDKITEFSSLVISNKDLPFSITKLTGITNETISNEGKPIREVMEELCNFVGELMIIGYGIDFDIGFINRNLEKLGMLKLTNKTIDIMKTVKSEKQLSNYKLQSAVNAYGIDKTVPHRALQDAKIIYELFLKLNENKGLEM